MTISTAEYSTGTRLCDLPDTDTELSFPSSWSEENTAGNEKQESLHCDIRRIILNKIVVKSCTHRPPLQSAEMF